MGMKSKKTRKKSLISLSLAGLLLVSQNQKVLAVESTTPELTPPSTVEPIPPSTVEPTPPESVEPIPPGNVEQIPPESVEPIPPGPVLDPEIQKLVDEIDFMEKEYFLINDGFGKVLQIPMVEYSEDNKPYVNYVEDENNLGYEYIEGSGNILISAPHSIKQPPRRIELDPSFKESDSFTGPIVKYIAEKTGAHVIYKTGYTNVDDNYMGYGLSDPSKEDTRTPYRDKIEDIIKEKDIEMVVDIHGYADENFQTAGVIFGTSNNENLLGNTKLLNEMEKSLKDNGFYYNRGSEAVDKDVHSLYAIDEKYKASFKNRTVANYVATSLKVPAVQIELSRTNRDPINGEHLARTVETLEDMVNNLNKYFESKKQSSEKDIKIKEITSSTKDRINLKTGPSFSTSSIKSLPLGTKVTYLSKYNDSFNRVSYYDKYSNRSYVGYIHNTNLKESSNTPSNAKRIVSSTKTRINLKKSTSFSSGTIVSMPIGSTVKFISSVQNSSFNKVEYRNPADNKSYTGYVHTTNLGSVPTNYMRISEIKSSTRDRINLKSGPSFSTQSLFSLPLGTKITYLEKYNSSFNKVSYYDKSSNKSYIGYIHRDNTK